MNDVLLEKVFERLLTEGYYENNKDLVDVARFLKTETDYERLGVPYDDIEDFVLENEKDWRRILSFGKLDHLGTEGSGRGVIGIVFSVGDEVLKLQRMDGPNDKTMGDRFYEALKKNQSIAPYVPMVYDHGVLKIPNRYYQPDLGPDEEVKDYEKEKYDGAVEWHVAELVETIPQAIMRDMFNILTAIFVRLDVKNSESVAKEIRETFPEEVSRIEETMWLRGTWLDELVKAYKSMYAAGLRDLNNAGNIGFRKNTGQPVFFDA